jgi:hypothetical protein
MGGIQTEGDTWEPIKNLDNAKRALRDFRAQGQATKGGEYHVMASVTEELKRRRNEPTVTQANELDEPRCFDPQPDEPVSDLNKSQMTHEKWDSGNQSATHTRNVELTGKLCRHVMALIRWKVGADKAMSKHVVWVLEEWLRR